MVAGIILVLQRYLGSALLAILRDLGIKARGLDLMAPDTVENMAGDVGMEQVVQRAAEGCSNLLHICFVTIIFPRSTLTVIYIGCFPTYGHNPCLWIPSNVSRDHHCHRVHDNDPALTTTTHCTLTACCLRICDPCSSLACPHPGLLHRGRVAQVRG